MAKQQLILVDKNNLPSGSYAEKDLCHQGKGLTHLAFTILILNRNKEVLLQDRKHNLWDHYWDLTNSHPVLLENGENETMEQAALRCLKREWGVSFAVKELFSFRYFAAYENNFCENEYCAFLLGEYNSRVFPLSEVAYGYKWVLFRELVENIKVQPQKYTPWLIRGILELEKRKIIRDANLTNFGI